MKGPQRIYVPLFLICLVVSHPADAFGTPKIGKLCQEKTGETPSQAPGASVIVLS